MAFVKAVSFELDSARPWPHRLRQWLVAPKLSCQLATAIAALCVVLLAVLAWGPYSQDAQRSVIRAAALPLACGTPLKLDHPVINFDGKPACLEYKTVCFDQERVISFDEAYSPNNSTSVPLPKLDLSPIQYAWAGENGENGDRFHNAIFGYEPLTFRPATVLEPTDDLRSPVFSNCTVPMVMWSPWPHNYGEVTSHIFARLWQLQADGAMSNSTLLVMGTPEGESTPPFIPFGMQPFSANRPLTFAELSARSPNHPYGRCFRTAYLCLMGGAGHFAGMYGAMRHIYTHYELQLPQLPYKSFDSGDDVLKVLIEHRAGPVRNILNWAELEKQCNEFTGWQLGPASPIKRVQCRSTTFTQDPPLHNFAAVGPADVLVVVHGSGCANWLAMKEGSAMLELRSYKFGSDIRGWSDWFYPQISDNIKHSVLWYALNIEDEALSTPSQREIDKVNPDDARYKRDRHITLPFQALQEMLQRIAAAGRNRETYIQQRTGGKVYVQLKPGGVLEPVV